jgi:hypothetical protein
MDRGAATVAAIESGVLLDLLTNIHEQQRNPCHHNKHGKKRVKTKTGLLWSGESVCGQGVVFQTESMVGAWKTKRWGASGVMTSRQEATKKKGKGGVQWRAWELAGGERTREEDVNSGVARVPGEAW